MSVLISFPVTDKSNFGEKELYLGSQFQVIVHHPGESLLEELGRTTYTTTIARREQQIHTSVQLALCLVSVQSTAHEVVLQTFRRHHLQLTNLRKFLKGMPRSQPNLDSFSLRLSSQVILDCIKLTIKANHHNFLQF